MQGAGSSPRPQITEKSVSTTSDPHKNEENNPPRPEKSVAKTSVLPGNGKKKTPTPTDKDSKKVKIDRVGARVPKGSDNPSRLLDDEEAVPPVKKKKGKGGT